jgi:DNA-binding GntR family transcriptional regulator
MAGRKPKLTREQLAAAIACAELRDSIPTVAEIARRYGVGRDTLHRAIREGYKSYRYEPCRSRPN